MSSTLAQRIDIIEDGYEFMLAYAARGLVDERSGPAPGIRGLLEGMAAALDGLAATAAAETADPACAPFLAVLGEDGAKALAAIRLVLSCRSISSQLIDNLNASIHVRALLTDLFLLDEALKIAARTTCAAD